MSADTAGDLLADARGATSTAGRAGVCGTWRSRSEMGDVLRDRVAGADAGDADIRGFAGFAESVVARVEVFALLRMWKRENGVSWGGDLADVVWKWKWDSMGEREVVGYDWRGPDWTHLELVLEQVFLGGHFAIEAQQTLFLRAHRLGWVVSSSESGWRVGVGSR